MEGFTPFFTVALLIATVSATKLNVPRLRLSYKDLLSTNRSSIFNGHHGQLSITAIFLDEYRDRLFLGGKDVLYSLMLGPVSSESKEIYWPPLPGNRENCIEMGKEQTLLDLKQTPADQLLLIPSKPCSNRIYSRGQFSARLCKIFYAPLLLEPLRPVS